MKTKEKLQKGKVGIVVSLKMQGTAVVEVERKTIHPIYKKVLKKNKRYKVDTNSQNLQIGDKVVIVETRPKSRGKFFKVLSKTKEEERKLS